MSRSVRAGMARGSLAIGLSLYTFAQPGATAMQSILSAHDAIGSWPETPRKSAAKMLAKYGAPDQITTEMLTWVHAHGPWKRTIAWREEVPHHFPRPHFDVLEQVIDLRVPLEKMDAVATFDGSVTVERTRGEVAVRCDDEKTNLLALNLAHDIITGKRTVEEARRMFANLAWSERPHPYTRRLSFRPLRSVTTHPDRPVIDRADASVDQR